MTAPESKKAADKSRRELLTQEIIKAQASFWQDIFNRIEWRIAAKAGVAASLSLFFGIGFSKLMNRPDNLLSGAWCVLSTFVVLQAHLGGTYRAAGVRALGVLVGSLMGGLFTSIFGSGVFTLGISVLLTVVICSMLNLKDSIRIACLSLSVVMILWGLRPEVSPWTFALYRFLDSILGILIAVVVAHALWPTEAAHKVRFHIAKTLIALSRFFRLVVGMQETRKIRERLYRRHIREINKLLRENQQYLSASKLELLTKTSSTEEWASLIDQLENIYESITILKDFQKAELHKMFDEKLNEKLSDLTETTVLAFQELSRLIETGASTEHLDDLRKAVKVLDKELDRFRASRKTRDFKFRDIENYFVYFYNIHSIVDELLRMEEKVIALNLEPK